MKIGIVTPWFDKNINGGCEKVAYQLAHRLSKNNTVEVFTTCSPSMAKHWDSIHRGESTTVEGNLTIHRLACDNRASAKKFHNASSAISLKTNKKPSISPVTDSVADIYWDNNINSESLLWELSRSDCDRFIVLPYLYGVVTNSIASRITKQIREKYFLMPCLHDEGYAYLSKVEDAFHNVAGLLFLSEGEKQLAIKLYGPGIIEKSFVVGSGIEVEDEPQTKIVEGDYVLYIGRQCKEKGIDLIVDAFKQYKNDSVSDLKLVLAGPGQYVDSDGDMLQLGAVPEPIKQSLLQHCIALFNPSKNESYSRVMYEAWHYSKPVVVSGNCLATATAVKQSKGGLTPRTIDEWTRAFAMFDGKATACSMGENGYEYGLEHSSWDKAIARIENAIAVKEHPKVRQFTPIHQLVAGTIEGDAITNHALQIRDKLRQSGIKSDIYAEHNHHPDTFDLSDIKNNGYELIYHHSIGSKSMDFAIDYDGPKSMVYHNVTPPRFVEGTRNEWVKPLQDGIDALPKLIKSFGKISAVSEYNANQLRELGAKNVKVEMISPPIDRWDISPDRDIIKRLSDGLTNIIFVGRIAENKCQHHLIEAYRQYRRFNKQSRLIIIGGGDESSIYYRQVRDAANKVKNVELAGKVSESSMAAYYRTADLYLSMSEHEGFGVPFIEAHQHAVPVMAFDSSAIGETVDGFGLLFDDKSDMTLIGALMHSYLNSKLSA